MHRYISGAPAAITVKRTIFISLGLGVIFVPTVFYLYRSENINQFLSAYHHIPSLVHKRKWHHAIPLPGFVPNATAVAAVTTSSSSSSSSAPEGKSSGKQASSSSAAAAVSSSNKDEQQLPEPVSFDSHERITIVDARRGENAVSIFVPDGTRTFLGPLDRRAWPELLRSSVVSNKSDNKKDKANCKTNDTAASVVATSAVEEDIDDGSEVFLTIGVRRAFAPPLNKLGFTHAVVLAQVYDAPTKSSGSSATNGNATGGSSFFAFKSAVQRRQQNQRHGSFAVFGYNAGKLSGANEWFFLNDTNHPDVSKEYFFYTDLTLKGSKKDARAFFQHMEDISAFRYKLFSCNCFSPIVLAMIEASSPTSDLRGGFTAPDSFLESLLITVPLEQNFGFGTASNTNVRPYVEFASSAINLAVRTDQVKKLKSKGILQE